MRLCLRTPVSMIVAIVAIAAAVAIASAQATPATPAPAAADATVKHSATTLGFGNVVYGVKAAPQGIVLSNTGGAALHIAGISVTGNSDFTSTSNCATTVAPGGQCRLSVTFAPHAIGARSGTLVIKTNAADSPHKVQLAGTGCRYFSPAAARFFLTTC